MRDVSHARYGSKNTIVFVKMNSIPKHKEILLFCHLTWPLAHDGARPLSITKVSLPERKVTNRALDLRGSPP